MTRPKLTMKTRSRSLARIRRAERRRANSPNRFDRWHLSYPQVYLDGVSWYGIAGGSGFAKPLGLQMSLKSLALVKREALDAACYSYPTCRVVLLNDGVTSWCT